MFVRYLKNIEGSDSDIKAENGNWRSRRFILKKDGVGFSFNETTIYAGTETEIWYKNHFESVYCIEGDGEIENLEDGKVYKITPGMMYVLDKHDKHILRGGSEDMRLLCVFNPPLTGNEKHLPDGSYELLD